MDTSALQTLVTTRDLHTVPESMPLSEKVKLYDAAMDYVDMKNPDIMTLGAASPAAKWKHSSLVARATLAVPSDESSIPPPLEHRPDLGHGSARAGIGGGYDRRSITASLGFKCALLFMIFWIHPPAIRRSLKSSL